MQRSILLAALVVGKGVDAASTVVVLSAVSGARETVPLSRALIGTFGLVGGVAVAATVSVLVVAALAEAGYLFERLLPGTVPEWYAATLQAAVYVGAAVLFAAVGLRNFALLL